MIRYNKDYSYNVLDDGYDIYNNGVICNQSRNDEAKRYIPNGTYAENAVMCCKDITSLNPGMNILSQEEEAQIEMQSNLEYLVCLMEMNMEV